MGTLIALIFFLLAAPAWAGNPETETTGLVPAYVHLTQKELVPAATDLSANAATRPGASPHDRVQFASTDSQTAYFYFTYPRYAAINRFEIAIEGQSSVATASARACFRAAYVVTPDGRTFTDNLGGTHASGGTPATCCGDCDADGTVEDCERRQCEWLSSNYGGAYPGTYGCPAAAACAACDCNGDGGVSSTEATLITSQYYAYGCPTLPNWEGRAITVSDQTANTNLYGTLDIVRAYREAATDTLCADGATEQLTAPDPDRSTSCSGLPGIVAIQRVNEDLGCTDDASGTFGINALHIKYYTAP